MTVEHAVEVHPAAEDTASKSEEAKKVAMMVVPKYVICAGAPEEGIPLAERNPPRFYRALLPNLSFPGRSAILKSALQIRSPERHF